MALMATMQSTLVMVPIKNDSSDGSLSHTSFVCIQLTNLIKCTVAAHLQDTLQPLVPPPHDEEDFLSVIFVLTDSCSVLLLFCSTARQAREVPEQKHTNY